MAQQQQSLFSFGFALEDPTEAVPPSQTCFSGPKIRTDINKPFSWWNNVTCKLQERSEAELVYSEIAVETCGRSLEQAPLCLVDMSTQAGGTAPAGSRLEDAQKWMATDIQSGEYEGGMKVWEGSVDLVHYLAEAPDIVLSTKTRHVLELGCGHGLPACLVLRMLLQKQLDQQKKETLGDESDFSVSLVDFNDFVLESVTLSNLILNTVGVCSIEQLSKHVELGAGDWLDLASGDKKYDLILAAETLYSEQAANETAHVLSLLLSATGVAYVATKRYYFGVGGGRDSFCRACEWYRLLAETVQEFDDGKGNIREILKVQKYG